MDFRIIKLTIVSFLTFVITFSYTLNAQNAGKNIEIKRISDEELNLLAEKANTKHELVLLDSIIMKIQLEEEAELFPADDLYDSWSEEHVNAYSNAIIPDTFKIDVTTFVMPFEGKVTSKYGPRRRRMHYGTDIKLQTGDTVCAAFDGKIRVKQYQRRGYGYYLVLRHPNGLETVYGHLSKFLVDQDQIVKAGEPIALGGNTGRSTGSHLHFECRFLGQAINPEEIVDFENSCTHDDFYVYQKKASAKVSNKYTAKGTSGAVKYHRVKDGDTLGAIALRYKVSVDKLCRLNGLKKTSVLRIGQSIRYS